LHGEVGGLKGGLLVEEEGLLNRGAGIKEEDYGLAEAVVSLLLVGVDNPCLSLK
jgi:hypothetical protein